MKQKFTFFRLISVSFALLLALSTQAQQAKKISLQGFLKDANGKAVADGQQNITFKLYREMSGGTAEWTEDQTINVFGGVYSTHLGQTVSLDNLNWGASTYYVGVTVQGTELTPRTELTFAPYSLGSPKAQEVVCSGAVGDIKHSILDPDQFKAVNGDCWVPMDGRALKAEDRLRQITGMSTLPNGGGLFIRSQEFSNSTNYDPDRTVSSTIAQVQGEAFASHGHSANLSVSGGTISTSSHSHQIPGYGSAHDAFIGKDRTFNAFQMTDRSVEAYPVTLSESSHSHSISGTANGSTNAAGGNETRPDNMNFWVYIRIN